MSPGGTFVFGGPGALSVSASTATLVATVSVMIGPAAPLMVAVPSSVWLMRCWLCW